MVSAATALGGRGFLLVALDLVAVVLVLGDAASTEESGGVDVLVSEGAATALDGGTGFGTGTALVDTADDLAAATVILPVVDGGVGEEAEVATLATTGTNMLALDGLAAGLGELVVHTLAGHDGSGAPVEGVANGDVDSVALGPVAVVVLFGRPVATATHISVGATFHTVFAGILDIVEDEALLVAVAFVATAILVLLAGAFATELMTNASLVDDTFAVMGLSVDGSVGTSVVVTAAGPVNSTAGVSGVAFDNGGVGTTVTFAAVETVVDTGQLADVVVTVLLEDALGSTAALLAPLNDLLDAVATLAVIPHAALVSHAGIAVALGVLEVHSKASTTHHLDYVTAVVGFAHVAAVATVVVETVIGHFLHDATQPLLTVGSGGGLATTASTSLEGNEFLAGTSIGAEVFDIVVLGIAGFAVAGSLVSSVAGTSNISLPANLPATGLAPSTSQTEVFVDVKMGTIFTNDLALGSRATAFVGFDGDLLDTSALLDMVGHVLECLVAVGSATFALVASGGGTADTAAVDLAHPLALPAAVAAVVAASGHLVATVLGAGGSAGEVGGTAGTPGVGVLPANHATSGHSGANGVDGTSTTAAVVASLLLGLAHEAAFATVFLEGSSALNTSPSTVNIPNLGDKLTHVAVAFVLEGLLGRTSLATILNVTGTTTNGAVETSATQSVPLEFDTSVGGDVIDTLLLGWGDLAHFTSLGADSVHELGEALALALTFPLTTDDGWLLVDTHLQTLALVGLDTEGAIADEALLTGAALTSVHMLTVLAVMDTQEFGLAGDGAGVLSGRVDLVGAAAEGTTVVGTPVDPGVALLGTGLGQTLEHLAAGPLEEVWVVGVGAEIDGTLLEDLVGVHLAGADALAEWTVVGLDDAAVVVGADPLVPGCCAHMPDGTLGHLAALGDTGSGDTYAVAVANQVVAVAVARDIFALFCSVIITSSVAVTTETVHVATILLLDLDVGIGATIEGHTNTTFGHNNLDQSAGVQDLDTILHVGSSAKTVVHIESSPLSQSVSVAPEFELDVASVGDPTVASSVHVLALNVEVAGILAILQLGQGVLTGAHEVDQLTIEGLVMGITHGSTGAHATTAVPTPDHLVEDTSATFTEPLVVVDVDHATSTKVTTASSFGRSRTSAMTPPSVTSSMAAFSTEEPPSFAAFKSGWFALRSSNACVQNHSHEDYGDNK